MVEGKPFDESEVDDESSDASLTKRRKIEHIEICLDEEVQCQRTTMFEDIEFVHNALPEIDKDKIDLNINFFGLRAGAPSPGRGSWWRAHRGVRPPRCR